LINHHTNHKNFGVIFIALLVLFSLGTGLFMQILMADEKKKLVRDTLNKGNYLASLISLHPLSSFDGYRRDFFVKTLADHVSAEGLVYCMIHDQKGDELLSFAPQSLISKIPGNIQMKSIHATGLTNQVFNLGENKKTIYEFAKPIFENGNKAGTVRLGFDIPSITPFSMKRISFMALIAFLILATSAILYYGIVQVLRPLNSLSYKSGGTKSLSPSTIRKSEKPSGIFSLIQDLERSFMKIKEELGKTEEENLDLATKLGVAVFEKKQVSKIIDSLDTGIILTDIHENIININAYMLNILHMTREEVIKHPLSDILPNNDVKEFISNQEMDRPSQDRKQIETTFPDQAPEKTFLISLSYLRDDGGVIISNMISVKDISYQKTTEKASQGFIAKVAHEFLAPLTTIGSYNEMLMDGEIEDREMQKEFYNTISEETTRLTHLIQNMLNIAKIEMGDLTLNKGLVKTDWLINDSLSSIEVSALKKNIRIIKNMPDIFPSLVGDKEMLKISLINILGNAVKYSGQNGSITISLREENNMIMFSIADTGYGISKEDLPHIFDKFYRSEDSQIAEQIGSGLGLAMTAEIIHLHGGEIEVQSEQGQGTEFTIFIPKEEFYLGE
jgi:PAS domain S-box-containing protein